MASKEEMKPLKRSPDRADVLALAVCGGDGGAHAYDGVEGLRQAKASGGYVGVGRSRVQMRFKQRLRRRLIGPSVGFTSSFCRHLVAVRGRTTARGRKSEKGAL